MSVKSEILEWIKETSYWFRYGSKRILDGELCNPELVSKCYNLFLEDEGLLDKEDVREEIVMDTISSKILSQHQSTHLKRIQNIANVNALIEGQRIDLSKNITIIFGKNGTGKSGYTRLLNNAFDSRGDKEILENIHTAQTNSIPECEFIIEIDSTEENVKYPENKNHELFVTVQLFLIEYYVRILDC